MASGAKRTKEKEKCGLLIGGDTALAVASDGDQWMITFRAGYGHYEYAMMAFGLANASATFQAYFTGLWLA